MIPSSSMCVPYLHGTVQVIKQLLLAYLIPGMLTLTLPLYGGETSCGDGDGEGVHERPETGLG